MRRLRREWDYQAAEVSRGFVALGRAAEEASRWMGQMFAVFDVGIPGVIAARDGRDGSTPLAEDPGVPYPTQSGVEAGREALSIAERVDATAARMGYTLLPWQRELAIAFLRKEITGMVAPSTLGKQVVSDVVNELRGVDANLAWIDEAPGADLR